MQTTSPTNTLAHPFWPVKSSLKSQLSLPLDSVIHHKVFISRKGKMILSYSRNVEKPYGVSSSRRLITPSLFIKKFDYIRDCLKYVLELPNGQREASLRLVRIYAYYGEVYPKAAQIAELPGCSKATFWRTIRRLKERGLLSVQNRYVARPHAQISNLYLLDKLLILIAKYLAEHIGRIWPDWFDRYLHMTWPEWQQYLRAGQLKLPLPGAGDCTGL